MAYSETTKTSYGKRVGNSLKGIFGGIVLLIEGTVLLFWNEGSFVKTQKSLNEGQNVVVAVENINKYDPQLNGKLIHTTAFADTQDTLVDNLFGIKERAIALNRKVEYFQWVEKAKTETKDKIGGSEERKTTYTYHQEWTSNPVDSKHFKDAAYQGKNFVLTTIQNQSFQAENVAFGSYKLPETIISSITGSTPVKLTVSHEKQLQLESMLPAKQRSQVNTASSKSDPNQAKRFHINENVAYFGYTSTNPQVGDVRVTMTKTKPTTLSVIAKVNGNTFEKFVSSNGESLLEVANGTVSAENMFANAHSSNSFWTWIFRLLGFLSIISGMRLIFNFIEVLLKVFPLAANIIGVGTGLVSIILAFAWTLLIIAVSWLFYRPFIAIILIAAVVGFIYYLRNKAKDKMRLIPENQPI